MTKISNYRITPLVERGGSSIRVTSISPFLPFDQLFSCPPLRTICMNNESLNESWRREVDEKIRNVRDACVEARVLITNICLYVCVCIYIRRHAWGICIKKIICVISARETNTLHARGAGESSLAGRVEIFAYGFEHIATDFFRQRFFSFLFSFFLPPLFEAGFHLG